MQLRSRLDHRFAQRRMSDYVDGELRGAQRLRIEHHAAACPECGPLRRALVRIVAEMRMLRVRVAPGAGVAAGIVERLREHRSSGRPRR